MERPAIGMPSDARDGPVDANQYAGVERTAVVESAMRPCTPDVPRSFGRPFDDHFWAASHQANDVSLRETMFGAHDASPIGRTIVDALGDEKASE